MMLGPLEGHNGPENWLSRLCGWFWQRDYFWVAWRLSDVYRMIWGPRNRDLPEDRCGGDGTYPFA